jgi:hypothetical protein
LRVELAEGFVSLLIVIFASALAAGGGDMGQSLQVLAGPTFESFARATEAACPEARARYVTPGDLDEWESDFTEALPKAEGAKVLGAIPRDADGDPKACQGHNGLSCSTYKNLEAISKAGLITRFVASVCSRAERKAER